MVIYKITNCINGKVYIGQTVGSIKKRWREHKVPNSSCKNIGRAIHKYGEENFIIQVIKECTSMEEMNSLEVILIKEYNSLAPNGYNLRAGGENSFHTEEAKARMSASLKGKKRSAPSWNKGLSSWSKGLNLSDSHKAAISASQLKKPVVRSDGIEYPSISAAAKSTGTTSGKICAVLKGTRKHTKGFTFELKETA